MYWIELDGKNILEFQDRLNWKGKGTKEDPLIINSIHGLNQYLRFKNISSFIIVRNLELCELYVRNCQNISFENSQVYYFWIEYCHDIIVENSSLVHFDVEFSKNCIFKNNKLDNRSAFNAFTLNSKGEKGSQMKFDMLITASICFLAGGLFFLFLFGFSSDIAIYTSVYFIICSVISSVPAILIRKKRILIRRYAPNIFEGNSLTELTDLDNKYSTTYSI